MNALELAVRHIELSEDNEIDRQWAQDARAELTRLQQIEAEYEQARQAAELAEQKELLGQE